MAVFLFIKFKKQLYSLEVRTDYGIIHKLTPTANYINQKTLPRPQEEVIHGT